MKFLGKIQTSDSTTITNLNADTLDGKSSEYFAPKASPVFSNEVVISATTAYAGQLRLKTASDATGYGVIFRNDGSNFYLLPTTLNDANGLWNTLRPFYFNLSTGDVTFGNNAIFNNGLTTGGAIYKSGGTAPAYYMSQDGAGRQHWYWNTAGGTSPTFAVAGEDANDLMHHVTNDVSGGGGYLQFKTASGYGKAAGAAISWTEVLFAHSSRFSYMGNTVWHSGNFIPTNYAPLANPTFTGTLTAPATTLSGKLTLAGAYTATLDSSGYSGLIVQVKDSSTGAMKDAFELRPNSSTGYIFGSKALTVDNIAASDIPTLPVTKLIGITTLSGSNTGDQTNITGSSGSCTGTSAYATHLTGTAGICGYSSAGCAVSYIHAGGPQVTASQNGAAMLTFHRPGLHAVNFGLDIDNKLKVGGYSLNNTSYMIFHEGNLTPLTLTSLPPSALGASSSVGTLLTAARADHVHKLPSYLDLGLGTSSSKDYPASGDAAATQVVLGNDTRLSNSRPASDVYDWAKATSLQNSTLMAAFGNQFGNTVLAGVNGGIGKPIFRSLVADDIPTLPVTKLTGITTLSGSNTGDQTITLTGDVTGSGKGSFAATLATISDSGTGNFKKIAVNTKGLVTGTANVTKSDITGLLGYTYTPYSDANPSGFTSNAGTVTSVTVTAPLTVTTATTTPVIGIAAATNAAAGTMSAADKAKLDGIADNATKVFVTSYNWGDYAVMRDTSGNFSAGVITASLTGNAATATTATTISTVLPIAKGGTGSSSSTDALAALGGQRNQNVFFAAPNGSAGSPSFRSIVVADLPDTVVRAPSGGARIGTAKAIGGYITLWVNNTAYQFLLA